MGIEVREWADVTDEELLAEGNRPVFVTVRDGTETTEEHEYLSVGWYENPQTHTLSLRRRVRVPEPVDEAIAAEFKLFNADEWVSVRATTFLYDPDAMIAAREQREAQEAAQAEQAEWQAEQGRRAALNLPPSPPPMPGANRQQRRAQQRGRT